MEMFVWCNVCSGTILGVAMVYTAHKTAARRACTESQQAEGDRMMVHRTLLVLNNWERGHDS